MDRNYGITDPATVEALDIVAAAWRETYCSTDGTSTVENCQRIYRVGDHIALAYLIERAVSDLGHTTNKPLFDAMVGELANLVGISLKQETIDAFWTNLTPLLPMRGA